MSKFVVYSLEDGTHLYGRMKSAKYLESSAWKLLENIVDSTSKQKYDSMVAEGEKVIVKQVDTIPEDGFVLKLSTLAKLSGNWLVLLERTISLAPAHVVEKLIAIHTAEHVNARKQELRDELARLEAEETEETVEEFVPINRRTKVSA